MRYYAATAFLPMDGKLACVKVKHNLRLEIVRSWVLRVVLGNRRAWSMIPKWLPVFFSSI